MSSDLKEIRSMFEQITQGDEALTQWIQKSKSIASVQKLPGDASTRKYYRVATQPEPNIPAKTYIIMSMEPFESEGVNTSFLSVQRYLHGAGVDVPQVLDVDPGKGYILLEDLGDVTLLRRLQGVATADVERHLYERVIDSLVDLQINASQAKRPAQLEAFKLFFNTEKLMWEVNFAIEHFYEKYLGRTIDPSDREVLTHGFNEICATLAKQPTVLAHRDFHSRNIMVTPEAGGKERLVMIDFQDARMGPAQYDLASLLRDSYYQLEEGQITRLLDYYIARWEASSGERIDRQQFLFLFDIMAVQRNFKAIGSFASFLNRRGNPTYLKFIGNTFENIRRTLLKYPRYSHLREVLFHYYYF